MPRSSPPSSVSISIMCPHCRTGSILNFPSSSHTLIHTGGIKMAPNVSPAIQCPKCSGSYSIIRGRAVPASLLEDAIPFVPE